MRPQFGSLPWIAVFTSGEHAIESPTRCACRSLAAPVMRNSTSRVAPSPSRAIWRASEAHTAVNAAVNAASPASSTVAPETPEASTSTVSLVLMSPSTLMRLKLRSAAARRQRSSRTASIRASVVTTDSMVAMFGWIMPAPLANPATVTVRPSSVSVSCASLATVSVVMIARAASPCVRSAAGSAAW
jgi:hypothetical protein